MILEQKLIVFLKAPRPGFAKTRLAETLGPQQASDIYRQLVERLLANLASLEQVELRYTPDDAAIEVAPWLRRDWLALPQGEGSLGQRLARAFTATFGRGPRKVVIIGADCPEIAPEDIHAAWAALDESDVVLGPASDGGYWLIGLSSFHPALFENIPWSEPTVRTVTEQRAATAGLKVHRLRELTDIDTVTDWEKWKQNGGADE